MSIWTRPYRFSALATLAKARNSSMSRLALLKMNVFVAGGAAASPMIAVQQSSDRR
jgi:hypothetical protein